MFAKYVVAAGMLAVACVHAYPTKYGLNFRPVGAQYSAALDRIIMAGGSPNALYIYDAGNNVTDSIALSAAPIAISVGPDGMFAAVLHASSVSYVNLSSKAVIKTFPLPVSDPYNPPYYSPNGQIVLAKDWIHVPSSLSINIATGSVHTIFASFASSGARLHPSGNAIYGTRDGTSPNDIERYDVSTGPITDQTDSIYHGDYAACGGVWFSTDGSRIYNSCGVVYSASSGPTLDMRYVSSFADVSHIGSLAESPVGLQIALIDAPNYYDSSHTPTPIRIYDYLLNPTGVLNLPDVSVGSKSFHNYGRWIFFDRTGGWVYVVMQADDSSGLLNDFSVARYNLAAPGDCLTTFASSTATMPGFGGIGSVGVTADGDCTRIPSRDTDWLFVTSTYGSGNGTLTYFARPNYSNTSRTGTITIGTQHLTVTQDPAVGAGSLNRLSVKVTDSVYSKATDKIIFVSTTPNELHEFNPTTAVDSVYPLPKRPLSVSVSPDGSFAAIGYDGWFEYVYLANGDSFLVNAPGAIQHILVPDNGHIFAFPNGRGPYSNGSFYSYDTQKQVVTSVSGNTGVARLLSSGKAMYVGGVRYSIDAAKVTPANSSVPVCGDFWVTEDGNRIVDGCAKVYRTSDIASQDGQPNGSFSDTQGVTAAAHSSTQQAIALIPVAYYYPYIPSFNEIQIYNDADLTIRSRQDLLKFKVGGSDYTGIGQNLFWNSAATSLYVIEQADSSANLLSDFAVATITPATCNISLAPPVSTVPYGGGSGQIAVTADSQCRWTPTIADNWITFNSGGSGTSGSGTVSFTATANALTGPRTTTVSVEGKTVTIKQDPNPGTLTVSPSVISVPQAGGTGTFTVTTSNNFLGWTPVNPPSVSWISISGSFQGSSNGSYSVYQNPIGQPARSAVVMIGNQKVTINQAGSTGPASYAGWLDTANCQTISGWAADKSRLGQTITVSIFDGSSYVGSVIADKPRPDVGTLLGDSGLHGFSFAVPSSLRDGNTHNIHLYFESNYSAEAGGSPKALTGCINYTGFVDSASCSGISGWIADRTRLNQSLMVSLWDGATQIASTTANGSRPDVGAVIGDNGAHGFNLSLPAAYADGVSHALQVRFESSATQLPGSPLTLKCGNAANYRGWTDRAACDAISGWAADQSRPNQSISVDILDGTSLVGTLIASSSRPDVGSVLGDTGLHGFSFPTPVALKDGRVHSVGVRFTGTTQPLSNSPQPVQCSTTPSASYAGWVDHAACDAISGWAADRNNLNHSISVDILDGTSLVATLLASAIRPDVGAVLGDNGAHAFSIATPGALKDGASHNLSVRYTGSTQIIGNSSQPLQCSSTPGHSYAGYVDSLSCSAIGGWAADRSFPNTIIQVDIYDGPTLLATQSANVSRPDVGAAISDNGVHGFGISTPAALKDGRPHTVTVRPSGSSIVLSGAQSLTCQ